MIGLGYAKMLMLLFSCIQAAPSIAYAFYYLFWGLIPSGDTLPWNTCVNNWNNRTLCRTVITPCNPLEPYNASGTALPTLPAEACVNPGQTVTTPEYEYFMYRLYYRLYH